MRILITFLFAIVLLPNIFPTEANAGGVRVLGAGAITCGRYNQTDSLAKKGSIMWALGYITAYSQIKTIDAFQGRDAQAVMGWIENYCQQNPLKFFDEAVQALIKELNPKATF